MFIYIIGTVYDLTIQSFFGTLYTHVGLRMCARGMYLDTAELQHVLEKVVELLFFCLCVCRCTYLLGTLALANTLTMTGIFHCGRLAELRNEGTKGRCHGISGGKFEHCIPRARGDRISRVSTQGLGTQRMALQHGDLLDMMQKSARNG